MLGSCRALCMLYQTTRVCFRPREPELRRPYCRCGLECKDLEEVHHSEATLTAQQAERIVGWALSRHLSSGANVAQPSKASKDSAAAPLAVPSACLQAALATHAAAQVQFDCSTCRHVLPQALSCSAASHCFEQVHFLCYRRMQLPLHSASRRLATSTISRRSCSRR